ncbi:MAG: hypothetical protein Q9178_002562 [Gyalolechia marmorata]
MTEAQLLSLYRFPIIGDKPSYQEKLESPRLLSSLKSHTAWPPLSLAIRCSSTGVSTSIAYAMPTYTAGWSVGLQELRLTTEGTVLESRLATPFSHGFRPLAAPKSCTRPIRLDMNSSMAEAPFVRFTSPSAKPTSLSYTHPYLLAAYSDNTMTLYMVTSNAQELIIGPGKPLCGHTSSVSGAHVGDRGKAVSVSAGGNDLRVWELEAGLSSNTSRRRAVWGETSVMIRPENQISDDPLEPTSGTNGPDRIMSNSMATAAGEDLMTSNGWLSFDEEQVVLLGEKSQGSQALIAATAPIKPATAQSAARQPATTAARKVTSAVNAALLRRKNHAIAVVKSVISLASAPIPLEELLPEAWAADTLVVDIRAVEEAAARSATNAEKLATSLATALKVALEATEAVDMVVEVAMAGAMALVAHSRLATRAADTDTCLVIAPKDRNATTAERLAI